MFSSTFILLALSTSALANVFITSPVASTTFHGGQQSTITWMDDGQSPTLAAFGAASVAILAGNAQQQTVLQLISGSVNVGSTASIQFTPDPTIGPNSDEYFVRFQSLALMSASQSQYPAQAFSAKFTMDNMTGTFNSTVQAQIDGQSTAPIGGSTSAAATTSSSGASATSAKTTSSGSATKTSSSSGSAAKTSTGTAASATGTSGAVGRTAGVASVVGAMVAVMGLAGL